MEIYGLGIVAFCMYIGSFAGYFIGKLLGVSGNVGGVGFAMLLLVLLSNYYETKKGGWSERTQNGILLLSALYIPIVVAMAGIQNVVAAFSGGAVAFLAGGIATIGSMLLVPLIGKLDKDETIE
ncbi:malonate transporter subunit MadL [Fusibacter paucivorans]|uniref:Malonate transporter subunit MadL n=1 Tax=Fusibacter paucivorans TaxID=76009 RepID=A0ABS5PLT0_9FIRM|nr:malonate transporter subunit MadL [Fusibacter paucivorans]MBS7525882.1 malonate transporter subunit MadL [Fusibacter paucivorans]